MTYQPDTALHAGLTIAKILKKEGVSQKELSDRTGLTQKHISQMINGDASITVETALMLENALGGSASFWLNLEKNYQETKARFERVIKMEKETELITHFPYAELAKRGYVPKTRKPTEKVEYLWKFFTVNSLDLVPRVQPVLFRKKEVDPKKKGAIATWLRCGEIDAQKIQTSDFSLVELKNTLDEIRALSKEKPEVFGREVVKKLASCGVALVYTEHFSGTGVSGAVRWVGNRPVVQISLLGKYSDRFWFNLFHEIGHLVCHGKKERFIEFEKPENTEKEQEANEFAANTLIPQKDYKKFLEYKDISRASVEAFANEICIHPEIVEGRLKHDDFISWDQSLGFQRRLKFAD